MKLLFKKIISLVSLLVSVFLILLSCNFLRYDFLSISSYNLALTTDDSQVRFVLRSDLMNDFANTETWENTCHLFDTRFSPYSIIYKEFEGDFSISECNDFSFKLLDTNVYNNDTVYNFSNLKLLTKNNFKNLKDVNEVTGEYINNIYVTKTFADKIIDSNGFVNGYEDLYGYPFNASSKYGDETFFIQGVYDENTPISNYNLNNLYGQIYNQAFFIARGNGEKRNEGHLNFVLRNDIEKNDSIIDFITSRYKTNFTYMDVEFSNFEQNIFSSSQYLLKDNSSRYVFISVISLFAAILLMMIKFKITCSLDYNKNINNLIANVLLESAFVILLIFILRRLDFALKFGEIIYPVYKNVLGLNLTVFLLLINLMFYIIARVYSKNLSGLKYSEPNKLKNHKNTLDRIAISESKSIPKKKAFIVFSRATDMNSASGQRTINNCRLLRNAGYFVLLCGLSDKEFETEIEPGIVLLPWNGKRGSIKGFFNKFFCLSIIDNAFDNVTHNWEIEGVLIYSVLSVIQVLKIKKTCKENQITVYFDVVEFQNLTEQNSLKSIILFYLPNVIINKFLINKKDKVICISKYLKTYFDKRGCQTFLMPFVNYYTYEKSDIKKDKIVFTYAGSPGKKDDIKKVLLGFLSLNSNEQKQLVLNLAGFKFETLLKLGLSFSQINNLLSFTNFYGKISFDDLQNLYQTTNFIVLLKNGKLRHAKADFPSKISQAMSYGIIPLCNLTSDLADFLVDDVNSIISDFDAKKYNCAIAKVLSFDQKKLAALSKNCSKTAVEKLSVQSIANQFINFIG